MTALGHFNQRDPLSANNDRAIRLTAVACDPQIYSLGVTTVRESSKRSKLFFCYQRIDGLLIRTVFWPNCRFGPVLKLVLAQGLGPAL